MKGDSWRPSRVDQNPQAITSAREQLGMTKQALADAVGISAQLMSDIETGWRNATAPNLVRIAEVLNCSLSVLKASPQARCPTCGHVLT